MEKFLHTLCKTCEACPNLITLEAGPEQCDSCVKAEQVQDHKESTESSNTDRCQAVKRHSNVEIDRKPISPKQFKSSPAESSTLQISKYHLMDQCIINIIRERDSNRKMIFYILIFSSKSQF